MPGVVSPLSSLQLQRNLSVENLSKKDDEKISFGEYLKSVLQYADQLQKEGLSSPEDNDRDAALAQKERLESAARQGYLEGLAEGKAEAEARARELLEEASRKLKEAEHCLLYTSRCV